MQIKELQLLELQARLASALGQLKSEIRCTICGAPLTGQYQREHKRGCVLAPGGEADERDHTEAGPVASSSVDFSFGAKTKSVPVGESTTQRENLDAPKSHQTRKRSNRAKRVLNATQGMFKKADGTFDRSAYAKSLWAQKKAAGVPLFANKKQLMGLPESIGGL